MTAAGSSLRPAVPVLAGLTPLTQRTSAGKSSALFAISQAGLQLLEIKGLDSSTSGAFAVRLFVAGDANADGNVNGADGDVVAAALGSVASQAGYVLAADGNDDGVIDATDVQLVAADLGFLANRPPVVTPGSTLTHTSLTVTFDLLPQAVDQESDPVFFHLVGADHGIATLNPDGHTVTFQPTAGYSGSADFQFTADDGFGSSLPSTITVNVSSAPLTKLDFQHRLPRLSVGGSEQEIIVGDFSDQAGVVLDPSYVTLQSTNSAVAAVSGNGELQAFVAGTSILIASRGSLLAATAITVGTPTDSLGQQLYTDGLNSYPLAVSLSSLGGTRQFKIYAQDDYDLATYLSPATAGTQYFLSQPGVVTITPDGLMTAVAQGAVLLTVINGPAESVVPVLVAAPQTGNVALGAAGGVVQGSDGSLVAVPPGVLKDNTPISIVPQTQADLPEGLPDGAGFAAAFQLDVGADVLRVPVQLAIPVAPGIPAGTKVYFYRAGKTINDLGQDVPIWWQTESGIVGADGFARTSSPPDKGVKTKGQYLVTWPGADAYQTMKVKLQLDQALSNLNDLMVNFAMIGATGGLIGLEGALAANSITASLAMPVLPKLQPLLIQFLPAVGLPHTTIYNVQVDADHINSFQTSYSPPPPTPNASAPVIEQTSFVLADVNGQRVPTVVIKGQNFFATNPGQPVPKIDDLRVVFDLPNGSTIPVTPTQGPDSDSLVAVVPNVVTLGVSQIEVARPDRIRVPSAGPDAFTTEQVLNYSTPVQLDPHGNYVFVALPEVKTYANYIAGGVDVIDGDSTSSTFNQIIAKIPVGPDVAYALPRNVAVTPDNTRAYVTLRGGSGVAVIDALALQQVDMHPQPAQSSTDPIPAPRGVALDSALRMGQIATALDVRGTVDIAGLTHWELELIPLNQTSGVTLGLGLTPVHSGVLGHLDPQGMAKGVYRLRLTATDAGNQQHVAELYVEIDAGAQSLEIKLPLGSAPYGIAIDDAGHYAYVADSRPHLWQGVRVSYVYVIDVDPASQTYNQLVETIILNKSDTLADGSTPDTALPQIAPTGLRNVTVTKDGLHVFVTAPNEFQDTSPGVAPNTKQNGNLIEIVLAAPDSVSAPQPGQPPVVDAIRAYPGSKETYGVTRSPEGSEVLFTNAETDGRGVFATDIANGYKTTIPLDLGADAPPNRDLISTHSPYGVAVYTYKSTGGKDVTYAFVAGRADVVNNKFFIEQGDTPFTTGGDIGIIRDPFGANPQLVAATRPIPNGYPTDLALSADGQNLYVSYQGVRTVITPATYDANGKVVDYGEWQNGAVLAFNAQAIVDAVETPINNSYVDYYSESLVGFPTSSTYPLFAIEGIDDLSAKGSTLAQVYRTANMAIDVNADYRMFSQQVYNSDGSPVLDTVGKPTYQTVFGVPHSRAFLGESNAHAPIATGGFPGGIAVQHGAVPRPVVLQRNGGATGDGLHLQATDELHITSRVDSINNDVCTVGGDFYFELNTKATVTLQIDDMPVSGVPDPRDATKTIDFTDIELNPGTYHTLLSYLQVTSPGTHTFKLTAVTKDGSGEAKGTIIHDIEKDETLPIGHTIVKGVDIWDGHLTMSSSDVGIPGRGLSLEFSRTYSSAVTPVRDRWVPAGAPATTPV